MVLQNILRRRVRIEMPSRAATLLAFNKRSGFSLRIDASGGVSRRILSTTKVPGEVGAPVRYPRKVTVAERPGTSTVHAVNGRRWHGLAQVHVHAVG